MSIRVKNLAVQASSITQITYEIVSTKDWSSEAREVNVALQQLTPPIAFYCGVIK